MADLLEKATTVVTGAKESVTTTAENVGASLSDAHKTAVDTAETVKTEAAASVETVQREAATSVETVQREAAAAVETAKAGAGTTKDTLTTQAKDVVDKALTSGIDSAKAFFHTLEGKKDDVSSSIVGAVSNIMGGASSSTVATRDLPISTDNQPLLNRGVETTPWWKNCCGVLDLLKTSTSK